MPTPSLILVPARFKTGKLYTPVATTSGGVVLGASGDFNVTRATTATRVNASGNIEVVASGIPRLDYFASGGVVGCPALLVEPQAQNVALRSEEFNVSGTWAPQSAGTGSLPSITANAVISPDGTQNAETVLLNRGAGNLIGDRSNLEQSITLATSGTYTFSVYAKATALGDVGKQIFLRIGGGGVLTPYTLTANWVRLTRTETGLASGSNLIQIGNRGTVTADNSVSVDLWGAQVETGSIATSYIPTTTAAVTRNADVVSVSGAVSGSIGQTVGTIYCEFAYFGTPVTRSGPIYLRQAVLRGMSINFSPSESPAGIRFNSRNNANISAINIVSGALQLGTYYKIAIAYDAGGTAAGGLQASGVVAYVNGVQVGIDNFCVPDAAGLTEFRMYGANLSTDAEAFNGRIRAAALYTTRLTNAQLAALTTP